MLTDHHTAVLELIDINSQKAAELELERMATAEEQALNHKDNLAYIENNFRQAMIQADQAYANAKINLIRAVGGALLSIAIKDSKKLFIAQQVMEVGLAIMAAHTAAGLALAHPPGPPTTIPLAAKVLKAGLLNAAAIAATTMGQMATGGSIGISGSGSSITDTSTTDSLDDIDEEKKGTLEINIIGDFIGDEAYIEMLAEKISEAVEDRDVFLVASEAKYADELA